MSFRKYSHKSIQKVRELLATGVTPQKLAMTIAIGIIFGLFPLIGITSLLCGGAALTLRLNMIFIQLVNYLVYPLQLVLFIPYMKAGNHFFHLNAQPINYHNLLELLETDTLGAMGEFGYLMLSAILLWAIVALPLSIVLYRTSLRYIKRVKVKI